MKIKAQAWTATRKLELLREWIILGEREVWDGAGKLVVVKDAANGKNQATDAGFEHMSHR